MSDPMTKYCAWSMSFASHRGQTAVVRVSTWDWHQFHCSPVPSNRPPRALRDLLTLGTGMLPGSELFYQKKKLFWDFYSGLWVTIGEFKNSEVIPGSKCAKEHVIRVTIKGMNMWRFGVNTLLSHYIETNAKYVFGCHYIVLVIRTVFEVACFDTLSFLPLQRWTYLLK